MRFKSKLSFCEASRFSMSGLLPFSPLPVVCWDGRRWYVVTANDDEATIVDGDWIVLENPDDPNDPRAYPVKPEIFVKRWEPSD
jgi:hypothetical protein